MVPSLILGAQRSKLLVDRRVWLQVYGLMGHLSVDRFVCQYQDFEVNPQGDKESVEEKGAR